MSNKIKKIYHAAIYVRLSKEDGDVSNAAKAESNSISNQKNLIRDFLKDKEDIEVVSERVDDGYTGSNFERPAFKLMLEDIKKGIVDCVIVKDLSRPIRGKGTDKFPVFPFYLQMAPYFHGNIPAVRIVD